ncbi:MAG: M28 family peptidase [Promethearchaeota archaeon]
MKIFESSAEKIFETVKELAHPRMVGSKGEKDTQIYLFSRLKKMGCDPIVKKFDYYNSMAFIENWGSIAIILFLSIQILFILLKLFSALLISSLLFIILIVFLIGMLKYVHILKIGEKKSSKNIIYEKNSLKHQEFDVKMGLIIISVNYDSIGRKFPRIKHPLLQKYLLILLLISSIGIFLISFLGIFNASPLTIQIFQILISIFITMTIILQILFYFNKIENSSNGAMDNASGSAVLLNIIERIDKSNIKLNWMDLRFAFFGAKKIGSWGANSLINEEIGQYHQYKEVYLIDIDRIGPEIAIVEGCGIFAYKNMRNFLQKTILHLAFQDKIKIQKIHKRFCINKNFTPFMNRNIEICSISSPDEYFLNPSLDNVNMVDKKKLLDVSELVYNVILSLDHKIGDKIDSGE